MSRKIDCNQKALILTFHTSFLTTKGDLVLKDQLLNVHFKDFWNIKINPTLIWYDKFNYRVFIAIC